jgi:hypothetical protein
MNFAAITTFVSTKLMPAITAIMAQLPALLSTDEADVSAAINAVVKVVSDLQTGLTTLAAAVKAAS